MQMKIRVIFLSYYGCYIFTAVSIRSFRKAGWPPEGNKGLMDVHSLTPSCVYYGVWMCPYMCVYAKPLCLVSFSFFPSPICYCSPPLPLDFICRDVTTSNHSAKLWVAPQSSGLQSWMWGLMSSWWPHTQESLESIGHWHSGSAWIRKIGQDEEDWLEKFF